MDLVYPDDEDPGALCANTQGEAAIVLVAAALMGVGRRGL